MILKAKNNDFKAVVDKELSQVRLNTQAITLNFYKDLSLKIVGAFTLNGNFYEPQRRSKGGHVLHVLLGKKIIAANHGRKDGDLILDFESNHRLILHDDSEQYESYTFTGPEGMVVV